MAGADSDDRIAKRANTGADRQDRLALDRASTQNRENTDTVRRAERNAMLRDVNTLLPNPPEMAGFHLFWATTSNQKDSVEERQRKGYTFVTRAELPDFALGSQKSGELTEDRIMINEMVLMKIENELWQGDVLYAHHELPNESIQNLKDSVTIGQDGRGRQVAYSGGEFSNGVADGYASLRGFKPTLAGIR